MFDPFTKPTPPTGLRNPVLELDGCAKPTKTGVAKTALQKLVRLSDEDQADDPDNPTA